MFSGKIYTIFLLWVLHFVINFDIVCPYILEKLGTSHSRVSTNIGLYYLLFVKSDMYAWFDLRLHSCDPLLKMTLVNLIWHLSKRMWYGPNCFGYAGNEHIQQFNFSSKKFQGTFYTIYLKCKNLFMSRNTNNTCRWTFCHFLLPLNSIRWSDA